MRETPSIVPDSPEDIYLVINHYSRQVPRSPRLILPALIMKPSSLTSLAGNILIRSGW